MRHRVLVSVILCAYNAQEFIREALESVIGQSYPDIQIIVVDDGSTDETAAIVKSYGRRVEYIESVNSGPCVARNLGMSVCSGAYVVFHDADDILAPDRVSRQVAYMEQHPNLGLSIMDYRNFDRRGSAALSHFQTCPFLQTILLHQEEVILGNACEDLLREWFGITGTMMFRRDILLSVSGFDVELRGAEDFNLCYRIARCAPVGILRDVGMFRRLHLNNLSSRATEMLPAQIANYTKLLGIESNPELRQVLRERLRDSLLRIARYEGSGGNFWRAVTYEFRAMRIDVKPGALARSVGNICRAIAIAVGIYVSTDRR